uniref:Uncharacterized protein n=1 Tax=Rhizophora mucronata TaxID=61149 RepID=A0A2P2P0Y1_RHIMU
MSIPFPHIYSQQTPMHSATFLAQTDNFLQGLVTI